MVGLVKCLVLISAAVAATGFTLEDADLVFHLFTRINPTLSQPLLPNVGSIAASNFLNTRKTVITIHGHGDSVLGQFNANVVPAHLAAEDVNVLAVDWSVGAGMYTEALGNAPQAGEIVASFANILYRLFGYHPSNIRIVGYGLGGHIAGIASTLTDINVRHIVALDPSLVGWTHHPERLSADRADVVEVLHTAAGSLGYDLPLGDVDFYPNGGRTQLPCGTDTTCSHQYSYVFYAESITRDAFGGDRFVGTACDEYEDAINLQCSGDNDAYFGGTEDKTGISGIYTFLTNTVPPFARG